MGKNTAISWADSTWNPIKAINGGWACAKISAGCAHCYADRLSQRFGGRPYGLDGPCLSHRILHDPLRWRQAQHIFTCSMTDLFWDRIPLEWIAQIFNIIASATLECRRRHDHEDECWAGPSHTFTVLTKRAHRMHEVLTCDLRDHVGEHWPGDATLSTALSVRWPLPNLQLGVSCENQQQLDARLPWLLRTPAATRVLCLEPLLGPIDLAAWMPHEHADYPRVPVCTVCGLQTSSLHHPYGKSQIDWVLIGGESGPGARPCEIDWIRTIVEQCVRASVPVFVKQDSGPRQGQQGRIPDSLWIQQWPTR